MIFLLNKQADTSFRTGSGTLESLPIELFTRALDDVHQVIHTVAHDIPVDLFSILGMRNLSSLIGELFAKSLIQESDERYVGNPHQDGYPDLLLMDDEGQRLFDAIRERAGLRDKAPFSPFPNGGLEIKATCGSVPTPKECARRGMEKPGMGDTRISFMRSYDWKAHHRDTNNLIGILWDFLDGTPHIVAVFFGNTLTEEDWGKIVQPKEGGGRTTSVSIMSRAGVKTMYQNWIAVLKDDRYIQFLNAYNRDTRIPLQAISP